MAYSIFYHWFFQKVCFQRYPTSISKVIEWFPMTIFLINCCLGVSLFLWFCKTLILLGFHLWESLKRDVIGNIFLCLCVLILSGVAVMMKMWGRRRGACVFVCFVFQLFVKLLILTLNFIMTTCHTSMKWKGINGALANGAKMHS